MIHTRRKQNTLFKIRISIITLTLLFMFAYSYIKAYAHAYDEKLKIKHIDNCGNAAVERALISMHEVIIVPENDNYDIIVDDAKYCNITDNSKLLELLYNHLNRSLEEKDG